MSSTRLGKIWEALDAAEIDALVVSTAANIRYLSGFTGSAGTLVVGSGTATLVTDGRYAIQAAEEVAGAGEHVEVVIVRRSGHEQIGAATGEVERVGLEADQVSWNESGRLSSVIDGDVVPTNGIVEALRELKDPDEVARIRNAASIADAALAELHDMLGTGCSERGFAAELDAAMRRHGADRPGFDTIVASGPASARPHHRPSYRIIESGDLVVVDFGAEFQGYRSDMTRSFSIGQPDERQAEILTEVRKAQAAGVAAAAPGVSVTEIDRACRSHLAEVGLDQWFTHGTGHGVGLDIHEAPAVNEKGTATLAPGHVITVEPGVYIPDFGGVRWEDTLVVTDDGAEVLTRAPKDPIIE